MINRGLVQHSTATAANKAAKLASRTLRMKGKESSAAAVSLENLLSSLPAHRHSIVHMEALKGLLAIQLS